MVANSSYPNIFSNPPPQLSTGPAGAGDAAAWAIQRSLRALDTSADSAQQAVRTINDIADDDDSGDASQYESSSFSDSMGRSSEDFAANGDGVI